jgi:hypothetical protein
MKNRNLFIVAAALVSTGFAIFIFQIRPVDLESVSYLVKILCIIVAALFCIAIFTYRTLADTASKTTRALDNVERILLDIRDGTRHFHREKRRSLRVKTDMSARFIDKGAENDFVKIGDISHEGLQMRTTRVLKAGDIIGLHVHLPIFPKPIPVKASVTMSRATSDKKGEAAVFEVGAEYKDMSDEDREKLAGTIRVLSRMPKNRQH